MKDIFYLQLAMSFIAGGLMISGLSFIAEKFPARVSGIILTFPTTIAIGLFFLGWIGSPQEVARSVPRLIVPLGATAIYPAIYIYIAYGLSKSLLPKSIRILLSLLGALLVWFLLALPLTQIRDTGWFVSLSVYGLLALVGHFLLQRYPAIRVQPLRYTRGQVIGRMLFAGLVLSLVVWLGERAGVFWGGMAAMFPAAFSTSLMIFHSYFAEETMFGVFARVPLGTLTLLVYALVAMWCFPIMGFAAGTLAAYMASALFAAAMFYRPKPKKMKRA